MERVLDQTCMSYPETYVREMRGEEIKIILESVADNLFNPDPYYQQGGDMVRVGGLRFSCAPDAPGGERIRNLARVQGHPGTFRGAGTPRRAAGRLPCRARRHAGRARRRQSGSALFPPGGSRNIAW